MKLWGGRFTGETDPQFASFNASFRFDVRLLDADLEASIVQARALGRAGIVAEAEAHELICGLEQIRKAALDPSYTNRPEFSTCEDVHSFIEARLVDLVGPVGHKLHTGRSRNDQVAVATRIFLRRELDNLDGLIQDLQRALVELAERYPGAAIPGYTHLQKAQPVLFAHFLLAYFEMLLRDRERFREVHARVNISPLGSGALAGTGFPVDREWMAAELGFTAVTRNSLDAVSDRDYIVEFVSAAALVMAHLSRLAEDLIIYSTQEFGLIKLGDAISTGSSLMPQKKNPDSLELVRGKAARVFGHSATLLALLKGMPLAYNKDLQEDKEALFDTIDTVAVSLQVTATVLRNIDLDQERANRAASSDYGNATDLADYLVRRGLEFRKAHELVGRIVVFAIDARRELDQLSLEEFRDFSALIDPDVYQALTLASSLKAKGQTGGTSPDRVQEEIARARRIID